MRRLLFLIAILSTACQPIPHAAGHAPIIQTAAGLTLESCARLGGTLEPVGRAQTLQCVIAYADAGKSCTTGSDCQGDCRVETAPFPAAGAPAVGQCQATNQPFGCHARVENGKVTAAMCID